MPDLLTEALAALANPTRREILRRLSHHPALHSSHLRQGLGCSRQAVLKHLQVLELAELITSQGDHGWHVFELQADGFVAIDEWLQRFRSRLKADVARMALYSMEIAEDGSWEDPWDSG